ncbi:unnamed protein product [Hymenolepis diminuta]|uniref:Uncharacterized protein n=1 Tax=Hymenolepis diminuta TaxID=6216 RepID=A0A564XXY4_HYMDI|nr:unnamed protein product [Hymenolepis diminuta]
MISALTAHCKPDWWPEALPSVLLGLRTPVEDDLSYSAAGILHCVNHSSDTLKIYHLSLSTHKSTQVHEAQFLLLPSPKVVAVFGEVETLLRDCSTPAYQEPEAIVILSTDASQVALGAILEQIKGHVEQPLAFFIHSTTLRHIRVRACASLQGDETSPLSPGGSKIHYPTHHSQVVEIYQLSQF